MAVEVTRSSFPITWRVALLVAVIVGVVVAAVIANWDDSFADCPQHKREVAACK